MRILMINDLYERSGGTEVYLFNLFKVLEERGHTVVVIYGVNPRLSNQAENRPSYFVSFSQPIQVIKSAIAGIVKKESPDIIHIHNLGRAEGLYSYIGRLCGLIPAVKTIHNHDLYCPSGLKYFYNGPRICHRRYGAYCLLSMLLNRCFDSRRPWVSFNFYRHPKQFLDNYYIFKRIIVDSEFVKSCLIQNGLEKENIEVLPLFTNLPELKKDEAENENTVLFAARILKEKGLDYLIRAMQFIKVPFKLLIVGDGRKKEVDNCRKLSCKMGLADKVRFACWEFNGGEFYKGASVVAVPSIWPEPFGIVGIRAMSYAKPVVAFNVGAISEWLEDKKTGFLIEPYNIKEMASKIELLLQDKALAMGLGQQGRHIAEEKFSKDRHVNRLLEIYTEISKIAKV